MCYMIRLGIKVTAKKWCFNIFLLDFDPAEQASESKNLSQALELRNTLISSGCETESTRVFLTAPARSVERCLAYCTIMSVRRGGDPTLLKFYWNGNFAMETLQEHDARIPEHKKRMSKIAKQALSKTFSGNKFSSSMPIWKGLSDSGIRSKKTQFIIHMFYWTLWKGTIMIR